MKIILFANTDWYLYNFRLALAEGLRQQGDEVVLLSPPGDYGPQMEKAGFRWVAFPLSRNGTNPFLELFTIWKLYRFFKKEQPDLVHNFTIKCVLYASIAARLTRKIRVTNSITGLGYIFINSDLKARLLHPMVLGFYKIALQNTQVIFQNLDDQRLFVKQNMVSEEQTTLVRGSGVDINKFYFSPEPAGTPRVVLAARMLWDKGIAEFVAAARILKNKNIISRFMLAGDCDPANPAAVPVEQLQAWQEEGVVEWCGWQDDMAQFYGHSHIVCLPSYREGLPRSLIEASACGRPIVASDVPGCRQVVSEGENGLLVPVRDAEALANAVQRLIADAPLREKMGRRGREIVEAEYSTERIVSETMEVYKKLAGGYS
ncbi:MAG TPA: glycosyltransferase family 4 protein [Anaerolineaceae bacterium]|nr:glycosyltransferase family 4 protein [Anaerolineaceae bacterium]